MATLLISAAVNIAIGLAINALFPPPDIEQEGPRLADLGFTGSSYGKFINIPFGTDRMDGNIIDTQDPAIEEVVSEESTNVGKGGGQDVNTTTYTYFFTGRISFCIEGATDLIRLWGDGKMIFDATGSGALIKEGVSLTFYPGGETQLQDPEEVARRDGNIPAYRHLTTVKLDRMPLADFGNRIPNMTAEIAFLSSVSTPFLSLDEPAGLDVPGSLTGADTTYMIFHPERNQFYSTRGGSGAWSADATAVSIINVHGGHGNGAVDKAGFYYGNGTNNTDPLDRVDTETGELVQSYGRQNTSTGDHTNGAGVEPDYEGTGGWTALQKVIPGVGVRHYVAHLSNFSAQNGSITGVTDGMSAGESDSMIHVISSADDVHPVFGDPGNQLPTYGAMIPDHERGVFYYIGPESPTATFYRMVEFSPNAAIGLGGVIDTGVDVRTIRTFTIGTDINGTGTVKGWAVNNSTGDIMWSNGTEIMLYNPITDTILATRSEGAGDFRGRNNYYSGGLFAWMSSSQTGNGTVWVVNTRDLTNVRTFNTNTIGWPTTGNPSLDAVVHEPSQVWDDRVQAIFLSRVDAGSDAPVDDRVLKVFVNRVNGLGVGLDSVVSALSTSYQRQRMAGLEASDIDVTTLAGETVPGYTLTRKSTMKSALEPLRLRYQFDAIQSDWIMKFPLRGGASVLTIPEEDVGMLKRGRDQTDEPAVQEIRTDDLSIPMMLGLRYKNRDADYNIDVEHAKRHLFPNPTMHSKTEKTLDVPLVSTPQDMKQTAQEHLISQWNERVAYKTVVPWTYIKLDPSDVFNMGVFGETAQLRMLENDLGAGWAIEFTGVVEDTAQYSSTLGGGMNLGHNPPTVPSGLPTRIFPLDAPVLDPSDLLPTPISNAYMAVGAFESTWPGASTYKSPDDVDYAVTGSVATEAVLAKVTVAPGAWARANGDFPNRIQEVADGGTMTVSGLRRANFWASATELNVLAGANHIAVIGDDGAVEIIGYIDVTDNGDNTFTLERLLRGRLGTEDIADGGVDVGSVVIGLSNSTNVKEAGPIVRQRLSTSELNTQLFFKGVTIGTAVADAAAVSFTYTGRDLAPFFPVHAAATGDGFGGLDVTWERRARGPLMAEWLDLEGEVVLNETIERYRVALSVTGNSRFVVKTVDDAKTVNFTKAEVDLGGTSGSFDDAIMPVRQGFTEPDGDFGGVTNPIGAGGWVEEDTLGAMTIVTSKGSISGPPTESGNSTFCGGEQNQANDGQTGLMYYNLDIADDLGMDPANILQMSFTCNLMVAMDDRGVDVPGGQVLLALYDDDNNFITQGTTGIFGLGTPGFSPDGSWTRVGTDQQGNSYPSTNPLPLTVAGAVGATKLRVRIQQRNTGTLFSNSFFGWDVIRISGNAPAPGVSVELEMQSETGVFSPVNIRQVT